MGSQRILTSSSFCLWEKQKKRMISRMNLPKKWIWFYIILGYLHACKIFIMLKRLLFSDFHVRYKINTILMIKMILFTYPSDLIILFKYPITNHSKITIQLKEIHSFFSFFDDFLHFHIKQLQTCLLRNDAFIEKNVLPCTVDVRNPVFVVNVVHKCLDHGAHHPTVHDYTIESLSSALLQD